MKIKNLRVRVDLVFPSEHFLRVSDWLFKNGYRVVVSGPKFVSDSKVDVSEQHWVVEHPNKDMKEVLASLVELEGIL